MGSVFFTSAAGLQQLLATGAVPSRGYHPRAAVQWRALRLSPHRAEWWAGTVQFAGTLWFNLSTFHALQSSLTAGQADQQVWRPDAFGSIAFLVASGLAYADVRRPWITWRPRDLGWSIATLNMVGSIAFGISAVASYVLSDDTLRDAQRANAGTFLGALCFLVGAALLIPDQAGSAPDDVTSAAVPPPAG